MINLEVANALFRYDADSGRLFWKIDVMNARAGDEAGTITGKDGYAFYRNIVLFGVRYKAHRLIWFMHHGEWPKHHIDHIDGNGLNNRMENLREATASQNMMNTRLRSDNTSGVKGVSFDKSKGKWHAYININRKRKNIGYFDTFEEAKQMREKYVQLSHNDFGKVA